MPRRTRAKPKSTDLNYLIGWFKVETGGDHKQAKKLAKEYLNENRNKR